MLCPKIFNKGSLEKKLYENTVKDIKEVETGRMYSGVLSFQAVGHLGDALLQWCRGYGVVRARELQDASSISQSFHVFDDREQL